MKKLNISYFNKNKFVSMAATLTIFLFGYIFFEGMSVLVLQWLRLDEYWRLIIIPVSLFLVWNKRTELRTTALRPSILSGIAMILPGCVFYVLWRIVFVDLFIEIGLFLLSLGIISLLCGNRITRIFFLPLGYLIFMTSVIERILSPMTVLMQHACAMTTSLFLNAFGWDVIRDGRILRLPGAVLEVAPACSGIGQLTALFAFAIPLGVLMHRSRLSTAFLVGMTIPLALIVNTIRIILISLWNYDGLKSAVHGPHDIFLMPFIYPLALVSLYIFSKFLARFEKKEYRAAGAAPEVGRQKASKSVAAAWYAGSALAAVALIGGWFFRTEPAQYMRQLRDFPTAIGQWQGEDIVGSALSFYFGTPDDELARRYLDADGREISLYIARFDRQTVRKRITSLQESPTRREERSLRFPVCPGAIIKAKIIASGKGKQRMTIEWFDVDGKTCEGIEGVRKEFVKSSIIKKKNNAAFIAIAMDCEIKSRGEDTLLSFCATAVPLINKFLETRNHAL